ncbi:Gfo/Idh/MocA family protein [Amorphoplanes digitatis]|uniref:Putative dehydrogenase n=1 Tax=Actinoplanes digitatis TaxID=1868 RepID=A0A7W7HXE7_9ACTN|nr:Gfo/Idh/MocA family oxidoreductase [Actinoplanes digitatis]MBB4762495.1 putative dehydrogenase [Actinoplanes digitatis]GID92379.1 oxidoreductase [Actinoplanes digitatis]
MTVRVALVGANGHGRSHRRRIAELEAAGVLRLVALADVRPIDGDPPVPPGVAVFTDHRELLATRPDVVVICTPPHTHLAIALDALDAGCDLLLEKPPVPTRAAHAVLAAAAAEAGRSCQVGFQALGSLAARHLFDAVGAGVLGDLSAVTTVASWRRDDAYYARAPWSGRRTVAGRPVLDGALVNPLAHAVMQSLAVAAAAGAGEPVLLEAERYRTRDIEVDDTAFARITFRGGLRLMAAVTLAGEEFIPGEVVVTGAAGRAVLEYPTDRLVMPGPAAPPGRVDLLENLIAHRRDPAGTPLVAPLVRTADFTTVVEALTGPGVPAPHLIDDAHVTSAGAPPGRVRVIGGINAVLREAAETMRLPAESGVAWAVPAFTESLLQTTG